MNDAENSTIVFVSEAPRDLLSDAPTETYIDESQLPKMDRHMRSEMNRYNARYRLGGEEPNENELRKQWALDGGNDIR